MLIDTHTHLYLDDFAPGNVECVDRALAAGIGFMVLPNIDARTIAPMRALHASRRGCTAMAMGLHPTEVNSGYGCEMTLIENELRSNVKDYVAVGEVGIDLYWDRAFAREQMIVFEHQANVASELGLPLIIHCREGLDEVLEVLGGLRGCVPNGVFHSFGGTADDVERIRRVGDFYFGINGIVTFKNSSLKTILPAIGVDRILLETDSPYLAPVPMRGRRNESSYLVHTAAYAAQAMGMSLDELSAVTTNNACDLFGITL